MKKKLLGVVATCLALGVSESCVGCTSGSMGTSESEKESTPPVIVEKDEILDITPVVPEGYLQLSVGETNGYKTEGYGCQVDTHIFKEAYNNFYTETEMTEWLARIDDMELQTIRTQIFPEWYERGNDNGSPEVFKKASENVDFNSIEMQQLYRLLDICEERDIKVDLSFYGCNRNFQSQDGLVKGSWLCNTYTNNWITAPKLEDENGNPYPGYEEFAESVYACLDHLLNEKKYTCLYVFSIFPEPNGSFPDKIGYCDDNEYFKLCKIVKAKLEEEKIWNKIKMAGPGDCANDLERYKNYVTNLKDVCTVNTSSVYKFNDESTNAEMYEYAYNNVQACKSVGYTWGVCESGSNRFIDPANQSDIDTYDRAIFLARTVINYTNAGFTNIKYWVLNDVNYGGYIMRLGLWKEIGDEFNAVARPQFYTWSLITKYTEFGSEIYPVTSSDPDVCMVAYRLPNGKWSYLIANSGKTTKKICITSLHSTAQKTMNVYTVSGTTLPNDNRTVKASSTSQMKNGSLSITLRSNSFTVISNK